jgi:hypothetical protein
VFDTDLQMRFWRSTSEAWFHGVNASIAAVTAMQTTMTDSYQKAETASNQSPIFDPLSFESLVQAWMWPLSGWTGAQPAAVMPNLFPTAAPSITAINPLFASPTAFAFAMTPWTGGVGQPAPWALPVAPAWPSDQATMSSMMVAFWTWPSVQWPLYAGPVTAALLATGVPYDVASPAARASLAALDAADAARLQMIRLVEHFQGANAQTSATIIPLRRSQRRS